MSEQALATVDNKNDYEARALAVQAGLEAFDTSLLAAKAIADKEEESISVGEAEVKPMQRKRKPAKVKPNDVPEADAAPVVGGAIYEEAEIIEEEESEETK